MMKLAVMRIGLAVAILGLVLGSVEQAKAALVVGTYNLGTDPNNAAVDTSGNGTGPFELTSNVTSFTYSFVNFNPVQSFALDELTNLNLSFNSTGGAGAGSPRLAIQVQDGSGPHQFLIHLGNPTSFSNTAAEVNLLNGVNLLSLTDNRIEGLSGVNGNNAMYQSYADALAAYGTAEVTGFTMIVDSPGKNLTLYAINASGDSIPAVPEPATLVSAGMAVLLGLGYGWRKRRAKVAA